jgi:Fe2+ or Zn2+ uptake regulation protein
MLLIHLFESIDLDKTIAKYGNQLETRIKTDHSAPKDISQIIQRIINADPTPNKKYVQWLIRTYLNSGIRYLEDLGRTNAALILFDKNKIRLPVEQRDINKIKSLSDLESLVEPFEDVKSGKEEKRELSANIKSQTKIIYNGSQGKILVPLTQEASMFWGQGTKWCTAAAKSNMFNYYNKDGNLYIILMNNGEKYQFHLQSGQLMDVRDDEVDFEEFNKKYPWVFQNIKFSEEIQKLAVQSNAFAIQFIHNPSEEIQKLAVQQNGQAIRFIDNPSEEIQKLAVQNYGFAIRYIKNPSEELQKLAVQKNGLAIRYIKNPSEELQKLAVQQTGYAIHYIKNPSEEVKKLAVQQDGNAILFIANPSEEIQKLAVQQDGSAIKYIANPSEELKKLAVQQNGYAIKYIDNPSEGIKKLAVQQNGEVIEYIDNPSEEIKKLAKTMRYSY